MIRTNAYLGSTVKYLVKIVAEGFDMVRDNFKLTLRKNDIEIEYPKSSLVHEVTYEDNQEKHNYYLCFDTNSFGPGVVVCTVEAYIPDSAFQSGFRKEIDKFNLLVINP